MRTLLGLLALAAPLLASAAPYEIGDDLTGESFWTSDPVLFVRKHAGHELKRMSADWAWTISHCLIYMKPLTR